MQQSTTYKERNWTRNTKIKFNQSIRLKQYKEREHKDVKRNVKRYVRCDCNNIQNTRRESGQETRRLRWIVISDQSNTRKNINLWKVMKQEI